MNKRRTSPFSVLTPIISCKTCERPFNTFEFDADSRECVELYLAQQLAEEIRRHYSIRQEESCFDADKCRMLTEQFKMLSKIVNDTNE